MFKHYLKVALRNLWKNKTYSFTNIVGLALGIIATVIAIPVAWWMMNTWLNDFAYRTKIYWWVFVIAGSLALIIAFCTVGLKALKAAVANPVKSLRTE